MVYLRQCMSEELRTAPPEESLPTATNPDDPLDLDRRLFVSQTNVVVIVAGVFGGIGGLIGGLTRAVVDSYTIHHALDREFPPLDRTRVEDAEQVTAAFLN